MRSLILIAALFCAANAFAGTNRVLDGVTITNNGSVLTLPTTTDTVTGNASTQTLTNKSMSGSANTFTNIPGATALSGQVGVANGGTGAATLTTNGMVYGNGTSAVGITSAGSQYQCFQAGASGVPTVGALQLNQAAAVSGSLGVANGGTGGTTQATARSGIGAAASGANSDITSLAGLTTPLTVGQGGSGAATFTANNVLLGNGTSAFQVVAPGTSGNILTSNGTTWQSTAPSAVSPTVTGSAASPTAIVSTTGLTLSPITYTNYIFVTGSGGAVTVGSTPNITNGTAIGQLLTVIAESNTNTVTLQDVASLAGSGLHLNGNWVGQQYSALNLVWDGTYWNEVSRR